MPPFRVVSEFSPAGDQPAAVAAAAVRFLLSQTGVSGLKPAFDASIARRLHPEADGEIPSMIHDSR